MNELFTLLIILAAIISFFNKIMSDRKKAASSRQRPTSKPDLSEWLPPWLEAEKHEFPDQEKRDIEIEEEFEPKSISDLVTERKSSITPAITQEIFEPIESKNAAESHGLKSKKLSGFEIDLASSDELSKGIVLVEILGTCKGKKNWRGMSYR